MTGNRAKKFIGYSPIPYLNGPRLLLLIFIYLLLGLVVYGVVRAGHEVFINEVRAKARETATLVALHIDDEAHETIHTAEDVSRPEFRALHDYFQSVMQSHHDIRYIYTMRPVGEGRWEYVVDVQPFDIDSNQDGYIDEDEEGVPPGREMTRFSDAKRGALIEPTAEKDFYTDQWGTFISGYAPIIDDETGDKIGVLGVDVPKDLIAEKLMIINMAGIAAYIALAVFATFVFGALFQKAEALETIHSLDREIQEKNRDLAKTVEDLKDRDRILQHELHLAQELQQRYLPKEFPMMNKTRCAASYRAASVIGGDLYDVFRISDRVAGFFIADVSGHGVSAALITTLLKVSSERFRRLLLESTNGKGLECNDVESALKEFMSKLNLAISDTTQSGRFITFSLCLLDVGTGDLLIANAGHNPPLIWNKQEKTVAETIVPPNLPLGLIPDHEFETARLRINHGDKVIVYTDGLTERRNPAGKEFGVDRFLDLIAREGDKPPQELVDHVVGENEDFADDEPAEDDQALLVVEYY